MTENQVTKAALLAVCVFLLSFKPVMADETQESLNLDFFRAPEASAFMRYGDASVNEYTGTADISVPLYTIKCKDIEIPLVLRYDASGIKVEQEASWVGLGWNLTVGGCVNYVCSGGTDMFGTRDVPDNIWTEYLTSMISWGGNAVYWWNDPHVTRTQTKYYNYKPYDKSNWMETLPYDKSYVPPYTDQFKLGEMRDYVDWGFGERDFYSVNVLGKSFMFFIDPSTLNIYKIGQAGEDFKVQTDPVLETRGTGRKEGILGWIITDSEGYVYRFSQYDRLVDASKGWYSYTSCWYLTEITTPLGEKVSFSYTEHQQTSRSVRIESSSLSVTHAGGGACCGNACPNGHSSFLQSATVKSHYLSKIETSNQTVTFTTSESKECSGRRLDAIRITSNFKDKPEIKTVRFSYSSFGYYNIGGNYAPADPRTTSEYRLKLDFVCEITQGETLTTRFSYNTQSLPSKRSCSQDYWGFYNGQNNNIPGYGYSLIPAPQKFMSSNYTQSLSQYSIKGADRFSRGSYMQASILNRVDYPTGGYTTYEYEPNSIITRDFTLSDKYREGEYDVSVISRFTCYPNSQNILVTDQTDQIKNFTLSQEATCDLLLQCSGQSPLHGQSMHIELHQPDGSVRNIPMTFLPSPQGLSLVQSLTLPAGRYFMILIPINNNHNQPFSIRCELKGWYKETVTDNNYTLTCGGLRIRKISNYNPDGDIVNFITYDYNSQGMSSGRLLNRIETTDHTQHFNFSPAGGLPGLHTVDVYTMTPGHPRMPAFFASCTPGIVGYSKVTKREYSGDGSLERSTVTSYVNHEPSNMVIDYYDHFDNGRVLSQEIRDASDAVVSKTVNTYSYQRTHYATNLIAHYKGLNTSGYTSEGVVDVWRYPFILSRVELSKTVSTEYCPGGGTVVRTKSYQYNSTNHLVSQTDENTSLSNQTRRTKITYSADGTDEICKSMRNAHRLNDVVEKKVILVEDGQERRLSTLHTTYGPDYLPVSNSTSIGSYAPEPRSTYSYDPKKNIRSIVVDGMETVYIWSYKGHYPIAKIEGLSYAQVQTAIGASTISALLGKTEPGGEDLRAIRNAVKNIGGQVTTYTYQPLVGMTSMTQPNGSTVYYRYDGSGRLVKVIDHDGSVVSANSYHYKNNGYE